MNKCLRRTADALPLESAIPWGHPLGPRASGCHHALVDAEARELGGICDCMRPVAVGNEGDSLAPRAYRPRLAGLALVGHGVVVEVLGAVGNLI